MSNTKIRDRFSVTETPYESWRLYCSCFIHDEVRQFLKQFSLWGGHDFRNHNLIGYELSAEDVLTVWNKLEREFYMKHEENTIQFWEEVSARVPDPLSEPF